MSRENQLGLSAIETSLAGRSLVPYQNKALMKLKKAGLPTVRQEQWRASKTVMRMDNLLSPAEDFYLETLSDTFAETIDSYRFVCVNGNFASHLSADKIEGLEFISLSKAVQENHKLLSLIDGIDAPFEQGYKHLNSVMCRDGLILHIAKEAVLDKPIHIVLKNLSSHSILYSRILIVSELHSKAEVIFEYDMSDNVQLNHVSEFYVARGANLSVINIDRASHSSEGAVMLSGEVQNDAQLNMAYYNVGAKMMRWESNIHLKGQGSRANIGAAVILNENNMNDHIAVITHNTPQAESSQFFQSLCTDKSRSYVQSKTIVCQDAQKTDGKQMLRGVLMSPEAQIFAKPELEIYADDVKCAHGSVVGQLDDQALYYLRARGIPMVQAKILLTEALLEQALEVIDNQEILSLIRRDFAKLMGA